MQKVIAADSYSGPEDGVILGAFYDPVQFPYKNGNCLMVRRGYEAKGISCWCSIHAILLVNAAADRDAPINMRRKPDI